MVSKIDCQGLVSVIIPCYNGGKVVHRLLDSLLAQSYRKLEIIFVNDGSTDDTEAVVKRYIPEFEKGGIAFNYIYQENKGLGGAINAGLTHITGEFFIWPDADDMLTGDSVEKKVKVLRENPAVALVSSNAFITQEEDPYIPTAKIIPPKRNMNPDNLFEDYLYSKGAVLFCSGCHMMRTAMFEEANRGRDIYPIRRGQNWQLLLPVLYKYKHRIWLDIPLYYYVVSKTSMSRTISSKFESLLDIGYEHEQLLIATLSRFLDDEQLAYYSKELKKFYTIRASRLYLSHYKFRKFFKNIICNRSKISIFEHFLAVTRLIMTRILTALNNILSNDRQ